MFLIYIRLFHLLVGFEALVSEFEEAYNEGLRSIINYNATTRLRMFAFRSEVR